MYILVVDFWKDTFFFLNLGGQNFFSTSISKTGLGLAKNFRPCERAMLGDQ